MELALCDRWNRHYEHFKAELSKSSSLFEHRLGMEAIVGLACITDLNCKPGYESIPFCSLKSRKIASAFDGRLTNFLGSRPEEFLSPYRAQLDSEFLLHLYCQGKDTETGLGKIINRVLGSFSLLILDRGRLVALRDPFGFRPLSWGTDGRNLYFSSESASFNAIQATLMGDVEPGVALIAEGDNIERIELKKPLKKQCVVELLALSRMDSVTFGRSVYEFRKTVGTLLAKMESRDVDVVLTPSSNCYPQALSYSSYLKIPFEIALMKSSLRIPIVPFGNKYFVVREVVEGRRVALIQDTLIDGSETAELVEFLRASGAREIHVRVASPPLAFSCFYGVHIGPRKNLLASMMSLRELRNYIGADSIQFLTLRNLKRALGKNWSEFCMACFDGKYPEGSLPEPLRLEFAGIPVPPILREMEERDLFGNL